MKQRNILQNTETYLRRTFEKEGTGHDWWHIERVRRNALAIARREKGADLFIVELGALLHDVADFKFHSGDDKAGGRRARGLLEDIGTDDSVIKKIVHIVDNVSFRGAGVTSKMKSLEGKIVQDADRLDALGAIGIARAFAYGGHKNRPLYDPLGKVRVHRSFEEYKKGSDSTLHHFYEKLLRLKNHMNTRTGKEMARERHVFIEKYLKQFHAEWKGAK